MSDQRQRPASVYDWPTAVGIAVAGTVAAVGLIVLFTYVVDWIGAFWSQVVYFTAVFALVVAAAVRSRRLDQQDPSRLRRTATPITPAGLPGPFVVTQAIGVLGLAMIAVGAAVQGDRGIIWLFSGSVLVLVGLVGLVFWTAGLLGRRQTR
jgi:hypothetical protein